MAKDDKLSVAAPEKWMAGWDKIYQKMLGAPDEELAEVEVGHPIQSLHHAMRITEVEPEELRVLELACGDGSVACSMAKLGMKVKAVDALVNAVAVTQRRMRILSLSDNMDVSLMDIDGWSIELESYDIVIALQCLQYLFDRAIPRFRELLAAVKPGGFIVYSGNILPHFETDPSIRFITEAELREELVGWTFHSFGTDQVLQKPNDLRGYIWVVARKPQETE